MTPAELHAAALAAIAERRALAAAGTARPWRVGDDQLVAGVRSDGQCAYCHIGEVTWSGKRDINGTKMLAHVHHDSDPWPHGIYAEREDGHEIVVNDTDEYGYVADADMALIVAAVNAFDRDTDALESVLERHTPAEVVLRRDWCPKCSKGIAVSWPCPDAAAVLRALGVLDE